MLSFLSRIALTATARNDCSAFGWKPITSFRPHAGAKPSCSISVSVAAPATSFFCRRKIKHINLLNLCLCCRACNGYKGERSHARDPKTGRTVALFHPRRQQWRTHFKWRDDRCNSLA